MTLSGGSFTSSGAGAVSASTFTVSGGTAAMTGAGTLTTTGDFTLSAGAFTANTGTVTVGGNLTVTGGTFTSGTGIVAVTGNVERLSRHAAGPTPAWLRYWAFEKTSSRSADSSVAGTAGHWAARSTSLTSHAPVDSPTPAAWR